MTTSREYPAEPTIASEAELTPGTQVGEYIVGDNIGEGGFGTVYRAEHPVIGKVVAIKVLNRRCSADPEMVSRFVAEARSVNKIRHRNIIDIFAFGQLDDGRSYYVMEYLDGMPLDEYLDDCGAVPLQEAIPILRGVAAAIDAAHRGGIAHRDLKPENIFLVQDSQLGLAPKLLDFGIAKLLTDEKTKKYKTRTGAPIGTPYYMSPEQCRGRDVDHRTDIYAFGCVVYRMLVGRLPFDGEDYMEILLKQMGEQAPPPSSIQPVLPPQVDEVVAWMMAKDPADRPPTLKDAVERLAAIASAAGVRVPTRPRSAVYQATRTPSGVSAMPSPAIGAMAQPARPSVGFDATLTPDSLPPAALGDAVPAPRKSLVPIAIAVAVLLAGAGVASYLFLVKGGEDEQRQAAAAKEEQDAKIAAAKAEAEKAKAAAREAEARALQPTDTTGGLVTIEISGVPDGTEVHWAKGPLGIASKFQLERGDDPVLVTLRADGHETKTVEIDPSSDRAIKVEMVPVLEDDPPADKKASRGKRGSKKKSGTKKKGRDSIESPF